MNITFLPRFKIWPSKSRLFCSQSIDLERKPKEHSTIDKWDVENLKPGSDTEFKETDLISRQLLIPVSMTH